MIEKGYFNKVAAQVPQGVNLKELFDKSCNETTGENHGEAIFG